MPKNHDATLFCRVYELCVPCLESRIVDVSDDYVLHVLDTENY